MRYSHSPALIDFPSQARVLAVLAVIAVLAWTVLPGLGHAVSGTYTIPVCPDVTGNGSIDGGDFSAIATHRSPPYDAAYDLNADGAVNQQDASVVTGFFGLNNNDANLNNDFSCSALQGFQPGGSQFPRACPDITGGPANGNQPTPDGNVNGSDLAYIAFAIRPSPFDPLADLNGDGENTQADAYVWAGYRGATNFVCAESQTPPTNSNGNSNSNSNANTNSNSNPPDQNPPAAQSATEPVVIPVVIAKTDNRVNANAGERTTYVMTLTNTGSAAATDVKVTDTLPGNYLNVSDISDGGVLVGNILTWNNLTVPANASKSVSFSGTISSTLAVGTTTLTNTATLGCTAATNCGYTGTATDTTGVTVNPVPVSAKTNLTVAKSSDAGAFVAPGATVTYTVVISNGAAATETARNIVMTDTLPAGFTFTTDGTSAATFSIGSLAPGTSSTLSYTVIVNANQAPGVYTNTATAKADNADPVSASAPVEVRIPLVLGAEVDEDPTAGAERKVQVLAETGPGSTDHVILIGGMVLLAAGWYVLRRQSA